MKTMHAGSSGASGARSCWRRSRRRSRSLAQIPDRRLADLPRRLFGPPLQHAQADQHDQREEPHAGLGLPPQHLARRRDRRRRRARTRRRRAAPPTHQVHAADGQRHPVSSRRPTTSGRSTRAPAARSGTTTGRRAAAIHIGNRGVGILRQLAVLPDARQLLRLARRGDRQGALAPRNRQHEARVLLDQRADRSSAST